MSEFMCINDRIEPLYSHSKSAAAATQVAFQQPANVQTCSANLTRRERQILQHILDGRTNAAIAAELFVSEHTIKSHLYNIFKKIDVSNRLEACNWARENL